MQIKHLGILAALAAVAAAAPHGGQQKALSATNSNTELCFLACLDEAPECPHNFVSIIHCLIQDILLMDGVSIRRRMDYAGRAAVMGRQGPAWAVRTASNHIPFAGA